MQRDETEALVIQCKSPTLTSYSAPMMTESERDTGPQQGLDPRAVTDHWKDLLEASMFILSGEGLERKQSSHTVCQALLKRENTTP